MGDAKRRQQALAWGQPWPEDFHRCPKCQSRRTGVEKAPAMGLSHVPTIMAVCRDCRTIWEAYPADWKHDVVEASPCDNCAFAKGSPESADRQGWLELLAKLRAGGAFNCHKGAPILIDAEAGTVEFDADWVNRHGRSCAGFVRVMQKWPDWLDRRFGVLDPAPPEGGA
jgi:hypothetical protein